MREIKCDVCDEVIMKLAKGSEIKPNVYAVHNECPPRKTDSDDYCPVNGAEDFASKMKGKETFNALFGSEIF